jgi:rod shape-determining protein MreC
MIRLSIPARQALAKLTLPVLIIAAFGLLLIGKADALLAERARLALADALAPIYAVLAEPLGSVRAVVIDVTNLWALRTDNERLRQENERLRRWQSVALALDSENQRLKANLNWIPDPAASFTTARVVADAGGVYARAVLLSVGPNHGIRKGEIALDERGLVGRVTEVGARTARVLLITDLNSRIPVILESSRAHAILVGTNGPRPRLLFWPEGSPPQEGERVVTSAEANAFPANLPVGVVRHSASNYPEVEPTANLSKLEIVRIFDYGLSGGVVPPEGQGSGQSQGQGQGQGKPTVQATPGAVASASPHVLAPALGAR